MQSISTCSTSWATPSAVQPAWRRRSLVVRAAGPGDPGYRRGGEGSRRPRDGQGDNRRRSSKGSGFETGNRRRGRPAWMRSPDDSPLRDGNRDRLMGLLTERAAKTLAYYFQELNPTLHLWLTLYIRDNEIPRDGNWDDVSGETFLRKLLQMPMSATKFDIGRPEMYDCVGTIGVNPREIAARIFSIRSQIAKEWIEELRAVSEENSLLMRETLLSSLALGTSPPAAAGPAGGAPPHPEMAHPDFTDNSAIGGDD